SIVIPRRFSSSRRSASIPVRALTSEVFPWSMWPAVPTMTDFIGDSIARELRASSCEPNKVGLLTARSSKPVSAPLLQLGPKLCPCSLLESTTDVDGQISFERIGIVRGSANVFDVGPIFFQCLLIIIKHDHAVTRVIARAPEPPGLVSA